MLTSLSGLDTMLAGGARELTWLVGPDNWFDLVEAAMRSGRAGATLHLTCHGDDGTVPLAALALAEFQAAYETLRDWWPLLTGADRPGSLAATAHPVLVEELRAALVARADTLLVADAPSTTVLALPPVDHELLADPISAARFWRAFLAGEASPAVAAWADAVAARPEASALAGRLPWLRVLLQRELSRSWRPALHQLLADVYDGDGLEPLLAAEAAAFAPLGLQWLTSSLVEQLRIRLPRSRRRPFKLPKPVAGTPEQRDAAMVTVLIPSFRHEAYIAETIRSVLAQTVPELRVLVVDDRSPDGTVAAARRIADPRLEVRVNDHNVGLGNSVLRALDDITTPFVALLNSDDVFHPQRLEKCLAVLRDRPEAALVSTGMALIDRQGRRLTTGNSSALFDGRNVHDWVAWYERTRPRTPSTEDLFGALLERNFLATSSNLVCRTDWLRGRAEVLRSLKYCLDWQLFLDAAREGALAWLPDDLVAYRLHPANTVWFDEQKRWAYSLEVDRVAARAIRDRVATLPTESPERVVAALRLLHDHLRHNTEVDWTGLYLNELLGGRELEDQSRASAAIARMLAELERFARHSGAQELDAARRRAAAMVTKHVARSDEVYTLQSRDRWQQGRIEEDASRLRTLQDELSATGDRLAAAGREVARLQAVHDEQQCRLERLQGDLRTSQAGLETARVDAERLTAELTQTRHDLTETAAALATANDEVARLSVGLTQTTERLAANERHLAATLAKLAETQTTLAETERRLAETTTGLADAERAGRQLEQSLAGTREQLRRREEELSTTQADARLAVARRDDALRIASEEIARLALAAGQSEAFALRWRGTRLLPGSGLGGLIRRLRKAWRKLGAAMPGLPRWLHWRCAIPVVVAPPAPPELLAELRGFCGEAAARLRQLAIADANDAAPRRDGPTADATAWSFPDRSARLWRRYRRSAGAKAEALAQEVSHHGGIDDDDALAAIAPHLAFTRLAEHERARLLIAHGPLDRIAGVAIAARLLQRPWLAIVDELDGETPLARWARHALAGADHLIARSRQLHDALLASGVAPAAVTLRPPTATPSASPMAAEPPLRLLAAGNATADAGFEELLLAARALEDRGVRNRVHLLATAAPGDQESRATAVRLTALRQALAVDAELDFPTAMTTTARGRLLAMRPALVVAPSRRRQGPAAIDPMVLAAMANDVPIVGCDVPAVTAAVRHDLEAYLVPAGDPTRLADAILALHRDTDAQQRLVQSARDRYRAELQPELTRAALGDLVRRLLQR